MRSASETMIPSRPRTVGHGLSAEVLPSDLQTQRHEEGGHGVEIGDREADVSKRRTYVMGRVPVAAEAVHRRR